MRILGSALKHGCTPADVVHAVAGAWHRTQVSEDPVRWLYVGVDGSARPLEIVTVQGDDGEETVIHAIAQEVLPEGRTLMSFEITDRVPGFSDEDVAALVSEAENGYDLTRGSSEPNPHFQRLQLVPADLLDAIDERAEKDGQSPEAVVRHALARYLDTA